MRTLDYIKLDSAAAAKFIATIIGGLPSIFMLIFVGSTGILKGMVSLYCTANLRICITMQPRKWMNWQNVS